jgi:hypothetical protein
MSAVIGLLWSPISRLQAWLALAVTCFAGALTYGMVVFLLGAGRGSRAKEPQLNVATIAGQRNTL